MANRKFELEGDILTLLSSTDVVKANQTLQKAVNKSRENVSKLKSFNEFSVEQLTENLETVAQSGLSLEQAYREIKRINKNDIRVKRLKNLLDVLEMERKALTDKLNKTLRAYDSLGNNAEEASTNLSSRDRLVPLPRTTKSRNGFGFVPDVKSSIDIAGISDVASRGSPRFRRRANINQSGSSSSPKGSNTELNIQRQGLNLDKSNSRRDTEYQQQQARFREDSSRKVLDRLDDILKELKRKGSGGGTGGLGGFGGIDLDFDLDKNKRGKSRRSGPNYGRSRGGGRLRGGLLRGGIGGILGGLLVDKENTTGLGAAIGGGLGSVVGPLAGVAGAYIGNDIEESLNSKGKEAQRKRIESKLNKENTEQQKRNELGVGGTVERLKRVFTGRTSLSDFFSEKDVDAIITDRRNNTKSVPSPSISAPFVTKAPDNITINPGDQLPSIAATNTKVDARPESNLFINTDKLLLNGLHGGIAGGRKDGGNDFNTDASGLSGGIGSGGFSTGGASNNLVGRGNSGPFVPKGTERKQVTSGAFDNKSVSMPPGVGGSNTSRVNPNGTLNPWGFSRGSGPATMGESNSYGPKVTGEYSASNAAPRVLGPSAGGSVGGLIAKGEGGYGSYNRGNAGDSKDQIDFSNMTVKELMERQALPPGHPNRIFAFGKYQVIPGTMKEAVQSLGIDPNAKVTPELQEHIFRNHLIDKKRPEVKNYITGKSDDIHKAQGGLAGEFASVADPDTGASRYGGIGNNRSSISPEQTRRALEEERRKFKENKAKGMSDEEAWSSLSKKEDMGSGDAPNVVEKQGEVARTRRLPIKQELKEQMQFAAEKTGTGVEIGSGGQAPIGSGGPRTGSTRHDDGGAADYKLYKVDEKGNKRYLNASNPEDAKIMEEFNVRLMQGGATGIGQGRGYMGDETMHGGGGSPASWGGGEFIKRAFERGKEARRTGQKEYEDWQKERAERAKNLENPDKNTTPPDKVSEGNWSAESRDPFTGKMYSAEKGRKALQDQNASNFNKNFESSYQSNTENQGRPNTFSDAPLTPYDTKGKNPPIRKEFQAPYAGFGGVGELPKPKQGLSTNAPIDKKDEKAEDVELDEIGVDTKGRTWEGSKNNPNNKVNKKEKIDYDPDIMPDAYNPDKKGGNASPRISPYPDESFADYMKRRVDQGVRFGTEEGKTETYEDRGIQFRDGQFPFSKKLKEAEILNNYNKTQDSSTFESRYEKRLESGQRIDPNSSERLKYRRDINDPYAPSESQHLTLDQIKKLGPYGGENASSMSQEAGSERRSVAPEPTPAAPPTATENSNNEKTSVSSNSDNNSGGKSTSGTTAGQDEPTLNQIPTRIDSLGLVLINTPDVA